MGWGEVEEKELIVLGLLFGLMEREMFLGSGQLCSHLSGRISLMI